MSDTKPYKTFAEFYPFYLSQHANRTCHRLHIAGSSVAVILVLMALAQQQWWLLAVALLQGYAFAWVGHFFFEHNKPATFTYPWFSFLGDWCMWWQTLRGRLPR